MSYPWQILQPKDNISIQSSHIISDADMHILSVLYKPLIKERAFSLYHTLKSYITYNRHHLVDILQSRLLAEVNVGLKDFYEARIRLEALGLLSVYQKDDHHYLYIVHPPLSASTFFSEPLLCVLLKDTLGEQLFEEYKSQLLPTYDINRQYRNITKSFLDVFQVDYSKVETLNSFETSKKKSTFQLGSTGMEVFDWDLFKQSISRQLVSQNFLTNDMKELIRVYHLTYGFNELEMKDIVIEAADLQTGEVNIQDLEKVLNRTIHRLGKKNQLSTEYLRDKKETSNTQKEQLITGKQTDKVIQIAKSISPYDYVQSIKNQKNGIVSSSEKWLLKELMDYAKFPTEVINILIHYILVIRQNTDLNKNYTLKIADNWAQNHVTSAEDAIQLIEKFSHNKMKSKKQSNQKSYRSYGGKQKFETKPDWMDKKPKESDAMDPKEEKELRERLKHLMNREGES